EFKVAAHIKGESLWESTCAGRCFLKHALIALYAADRVRRPQLGLPRSLHLDIQIHELLEPNVQLVWIALVRDAIPKKQFVLFYPEDADCRIESAPDNSKEFIIAMRVGGQSFGESLPHLPYHRDGRLCFAHRLGRSYLGGYCLYRRLRERNRSVFPPSPNRTSLGTKR